MSEEKYIELFSKARIDSYSSIDEHEANFEMIDKIASKLTRIEIIIRNRIDRKMCEKNQYWMFDLPGDIKLDSDDGEIKDHDILVSRQTFGFWVKVARHYKIESDVFEKNYLNNLSFQKYCQFNHDKDRGKKRPFRRWQKSRIVLQLAKSIRNRAFHSENLLKMQKNGLPRLSVKVDFENKDFAIKRINPNKLVNFLDDVLESFKVDIKK